MQNQDSAEKTPLAQPQPEEVSKADRDLMRAAVSGKAELLAEALAAGANPNAQMQYVKLTALMQAAAQERVECARILAPLSDPTLRDSAGHTALIIAAERGNLDILMLALPGSNPLAASHRGKTALMFAADSGHDACVQALLPAGGHNLRDEEGLTAFDWAVKNERWNSADLLAPWAPRQIADAALALAGPERMPRWAATVERDALLVAAGGVGRETTEDADLAQKSKKLRSRSL